MQLHTYDTKQAVAKEFSKFLTDFIKEKERVHIALSGGSTPKIVFDLLASEYNDRIDWSKVYLYWGDERCVPPSDEESNYKMTHTHLLGNINIPEAHIYRIKGEEDPEQEAQRYADVLQENVPKKAGIPTFDLVILGMGDDGHTASIFPHQIELWKHKENCVVATHPDSGQKRVSITGKIINNASTVAFLVTGTAKAEKVKAVVEQLPESEAYPARLVNPKSDDLHWFLDTAAAQKLSKS